MKLKDILTKEVWNKYGDMDVTNDVVDEFFPAWCGNVLTEEGKEEWADALELEAEIVPVHKDYAFIHIKIDDPDEKVWKANRREAKGLFESLCGYCSEEEYNRWFTDEEEQELDEAAMKKASFVKMYLEPMAVAMGAGIKDVTYYKHDKPYIDENYRTHYDEELVVTYDNGYTRLINVECDSLAAMVEDLYKQGGVY